MVFFSCSIYANDGVFSGSGSTLAPIKETTIELKKEILAFDIEPERTNVNVDFIFWNPGRELTLTVGFVAPKGVDGVDEYIFPEIINFTTIANGKKLNYKVAELAETNFEYLKKYLTNLQSYSILMLLLKKGKIRLFTALIFMAVEIMVVAKFYLISLKLEIYGQMSRMMISP